jgi:hypothetical protein
MSKTTKKLKTIRKNTINNTTEKEWGGGGGSIHQKWHQGKGVAPREVEEHKKKHQET